MTKSAADFCQLLPPEQQVQVDVNGSRPLPPDKGLGCGWLSTPDMPRDVGIQLQALPMGLDQAVDRSGEPLPETAAKYTIQGFPAQQAQNGAGLESFGCRVDVDVAEGQTLEVGYLPMGGPPMSNQDMCAKAKQAAEFAVGNLQQQG